MKEKIATVTRLRRQVASPLVRTSRNSRSLERSWKGVFPPPPPPPPSPPPPPGPPDPAAGRWRAGVSDAFNGFASIVRPPSCVSRRAGASGAFAVGASGAASPGGACSAAAVCDGPVGAVAGEDCGSAVGGASLVRVSACEASSVHGGKPGAVGSGAIAGRPGARSALPRPRRIVARAGIIGRCDVAVGGGRSVLGLEGPQRGAERDVLVAARRKLRFAARLVGRPLAAAAAADAAVP